MRCAVSRRPQECRRGLLRLLAEQLIELRDVYERPFAESHPVIAIDESPPQLVSEVRTGFTDSKGIHYEDYEYRREGVVDLYLVYEPLAGRREIFVRENHN